MKFIIYFFILSHLSFLGIGQKKVLDYSADDRWPTLQYESISHDGRFVAYCVFSNEKGQTWVVQATNHAWKKEIAMVQDAAFTPDSRLLVFMNKNDSLGILDLEKDSVTYLEHVSSFKLPAEGDGKWLGVLMKMPAKGFLLFNLSSGVITKFYDVKYFTFDDNAKVLLLQVGNSSDSTEIQTTLWIDLKNYNEFKIDHSSKANYFSFDDSSKRVIFLAKTTGQGSNLWVLKYFKPGMDSAKVLVESSTRGMDGLNISEGDISFSRGGDKIFLRLCKPQVAELEKDSQDLKHVEIRDYKDEILPDAYNRIWAVVHLDDKPTVVQLEQDSDFKGYDFRVNNCENGEYALAEGTPSRKQDPLNPGDQFRRNLYLVVTKDGSRKLVRRNCIIYARFSSMGKYVIWYDRERNQWGTYRISDGVSKIITVNISNVLYAEGDDRSDITRWEGLAGWLENDKYVLVYDRYDIWQVDPEGIKAPINITHGFGRRNNIRLRYIDFANGPYGDFNKNHPTPIHEKDTLLLSAFNVVSKDNGFFTLDMTKNHQLRRLVMGKDTYYYPDRLWSKDIMGIINPTFPVNAKDAKAYLLRRMNAGEYPNLYFTRDFSEFEQLTDLGPQKDYNWYTTELIHFVLPNGHRSEGILYKPEDFDPKKKYPIIFYYYERNADALHSFIEPKLCNGSLNIPWFVSNGYLVCVPDIIFYKRGYPGECAFQAVNAAANLLSRKNWVNSKAMGLQGHSYGGWETNYIVTRTNRFAAAACSSGFCDAVSLNSQVSGPLSGYFEVYQGRLPVSFWKNPEVYVRNSPIFNANKVATPLLILHNRTDPQVPFMQSKEWYNGLTHLQKKVWLLSYNDDHGLLDEANQLDYSIRLAQFYNHYLRRELPPKWMTADKHRFQERENSGYELDSSGAQP